MSLEDRSDPENDEPENLNFLGDVIKHQNSIIERMRTLFEVPSSLSVPSRGLDNVLEDVLASIEEAVESKLSCVLIKREGRLEPLALRHYTRDSFDPFTVPVADTIAGEVVQRGEPVRLNKLHLKQDRTSWLEENLYDVQPYNTLSFPLKDDDEVFGVLQVFNKKGSRHFGEDEFENLASIMPSISVTIKYAFLNRRHEETFLATIASMNETIEMRDQYTGNHTDRVMLYSEAMADEMGLRKETVENLKQSAVLHDLGKVAVPDEVLYKDGELSEEEFEIIRKHPDLGAEIIDDIPQVDEIVGGIRHHHEDWDGTGYPAGLEGTEIPLIARILRVADAFDAITTKRSYSEAENFDVAVKELREKTKEHFDPESVNAFLELVDRGEVHEIYRRHTGKEDLEVSLKR